MMASKKENPTLTIVTVTLNDEDGLRSTLTSVAQQKGCTDFEHLVVDGLSAYNVRQLVDSIGCNATLHQERDAGIYDAMNIGTRLASGDYILYLNGGDILSSDSVIQETVSCINKEYPDFLYGDSLEKLLSGKIQTKYARSHLNLQYGMFTHHQSMVFKKDILQKNEIYYDLSFPIASDYDFTVRFLRNAKKIIKYKGAISMFSEGGVSSINHNQGRIEQFRIRRNHYNGLLFASYVYLLQNLTKYIRIVSPSTYWRIKHIFR